MFIRTKRSRFGIKLYLLCDASGYCLFAQVYYGKDSQTLVMDNLPEDLTKSEIVVISLLSQAGLLDKGYIVHIDNWYCSLHLVEYLRKERGTGVRGTTRPNRGIPNELKNVKQKPVSSTFMCKNEVLSVKFTDRKDVYVLSSVDQAAFCDKERVQKGGNRVVIKKPSMIDLYNQNMGGVDVQDQMIDYYNPVRHSHAWFKKIGLNLCFRLVLNAFMQYRNEKKPKADFLKFLQKTVLYLTTIPCKAPSRRSGNYYNAARPVHQANPIPPQIHTCVQIPRSATKRYPTKRCHTCFDKGDRKESRYYCPQCPGMPGLCRGDCFQTYHV